MQDLETYRDILPTVENNSDVFMGFYPQQINALLETMVGVDSIPKKEKMKQFMSQAFQRRSLPKMFLDMVKLGGPMLR